MLLTRESLAAILTGKRMHDAKIGLVYGISADQTWGQFFSYLHGLIEKKDVSHVLITPSRFGEANLKDQSLKDKVTFVSNLDQIPVTPEKGHVYIVQTAMLPHEVFVSMTALSMKNGVIPVNLLTRLRDSLIQFSPKASSYADARAFSLLEATLAELFSTEFSIPRSQPKFLQLANLVDLQQVQPRAY